jgi:1-acyl-sn-glycerol-3-phosphate acyltransferase
MIGNPIFATAQSTSRFISTVAFDIKIYGIHHVPRTGGVLIAGNHQSYIDPPAIASQIPRMTNFLGKSELFPNRLIDYVNRKMGAFPVRQGAGDVGAIREAIKRLQEGAALVLFPEGTRTPNGELQPIEAGIGLILRKAGVPVVPVAIEGSFDAWPGARKIFRSHPIRMRFGPPMQLGHLKAAAIVKTIDETFHRMVAELKADIQAEREAGRPLFFSRRHTR